MAGGQIVKFADSRYNVRIDCFAPVKSNWFDGGEGVCPRYWTDLGGIGPPACGAVRLRISGAPEVGTG